MVNHIKQFRQKKKLTQKKLAKELGITQTVVGKYEHGDISPRHDKWQTQETQSHLFFNLNSEETKSHESNPLELKDKLKEENKWSKLESTLFQAPTSMCRSHLMTSDTRCRTQCLRGPSL